jgi:hypothetical protein
MYGYAAEDLVDSGKQSYHLERSILPQKMQRPRAVFAAAPAQ